MTDTSPMDLNRAKRNVAILAAANAILGSQVTIVFVIGGLVGQQLTPFACLATLPITMIVFGSMTTAPWLSNLMQRYGRQKGFFLGAMAAILGSAVAAFAVMQSNFWLLLVGSYLTGIYMSSQGFFRFAATDTAPDDYKPKAISYVMAGGLVSALIGPQIVKFTSEATVVPFLGTYGAAILVGLVGISLFAFLDIPVPRAAAQDQSAPKGRSRVELLKSPEIAVAVVCAMVAYGLMNLVMTSTPLAMVGCGFSTGNASDVVSAHVLAMFAPSFFTGHLIARFGTDRIVATGLLLLTAAGVVALQGVELFNFFGALVLLGLGWNFAFIGATTMLSRAHSDEERGRVQGMNDLIVFGCVTFASLASGGLMNCAGGDAVAGWNAVNLAMVPFLVLAGGALIWLNLRHRAPA
ncbi:MAG: MFS transporter [Rhodobacteraceae bacterium]|nr:MFS transporter [Paracoccaceae bacterium]